MLVESHNHENHTFLLFLKGVIIRDANISNALEQFSRTKNPAQFLFSMLLKHFSDFFWFEWEVTNVLFNKPSSKKICIDWIIFGSKSWTKCAKKLHQFVKAWKPSTNVTKKHQSTRSPAWKRSKMRSVNKFKSVKDTSKTWTMKSINCETI